MSKLLYVGVLNKTRAVTKLYIGSNNVSKNIKSGYIGINNIAHQFYSKTMYTWSRWSILNTPVTYYELRQQSESGVLTTGTAVVRYMNGGTWSNLTSLFDSTSGYFKVGASDWGGIGDPTLNSRIGWYISMRSGTSFGVYINSFNNSGTNTATANYTITARPVDCSYTTQSKGSTSYGSVTSSSRNTYPDNGKFGAYWYVYVGQI